MMISRTGVLNWGQLRLLGPETEPPIKPEVLIFHTMVGYLKGTESVFKVNGYTGDESTWGLGGPWDGASLDGVMWQWQYANRQADAQFAGNAYACSCETSDGGHPNHPWSSKQLEALIRLGVDFCRYTGRKPYLVNKTGAIGDGAFGYHELRHDWNTDGHVCPGAIREGQLRTIVIPKIRAAVEGKPAPVTPKPKPVPAHQPGGVIEVDGIMGHETIGAMQHILIAAGKYHGPVDGIFGPATRVALQMYLGVRADGVIGPVTVRALQSHVSVAASGTWDRNTTRAVQTALNAGRF